MEDTLNTEILFDRSSWGLIELTGVDRSRFLHNQSTAPINSLQPGRGTETVFLDSTARTLDLATVYATDESLLLLVSPGRQQFLIDWMDRYIFPADKVYLKDLTGNFGIFTVIGDKSGEYLQKIGIGGDFLQGVRDSHNFIADLNLRVAIGTGLDLPGYTLIGSPAVGEELKKLGIRTGDLEIWEKLRIRQGRPAVGKELTEDYNPLEAGLWRAVVFDKGCYIGQETIARLNTYKGVKQRLWGIKLTEPVTPGTPITLEGAKIGIVTSTVDNLALGYVKTKAGGEGLKVHIGDTTGELIAVPFLSHEYP